MDKNKSIRKSIIIIIYNNGRNIYILGVIFIIIYIFYKYKYKQKVETIKNNILTIEFYEWKRLYYKMIVLNKLNTKKNHYHIIKNLIE
jgi:hypothetical protein